MQESSSDLPPCPPDCKLIPLTQGKFAIVDTSRFEELNIHKWYCHKGYAVRQSTKAEGDVRRQIYMHRVVFGTGAGVDTDHKNGNRLDNRLENLRPCNDMQNQQNRGPSPSNTSGYKGVHFCRSTKRWRARIKVNGILKHIGFYDTPQEGGEAYRLAAIKWHGEFARYE